MLLYKIQNKLEFIKYDIPNFFKNIWLFRKELKNYNWFDYSGSIGLFRRALEIQANLIDEKGNEVDSYRHRKVKKMKEAVEILRNFEEDNWFELSQKELNLKIIHYAILPPRKEGKYTIFDHSDLTEKERENNIKIYKHARVIANRELLNLFKILREQKHKPYSPGDEYIEYFDGSGIEGWWD